MVHYRNIWVVLRSSLFDQTLLQYYWHDCLPNRLTSDTINVIYYSSVLYFLYYIGILVSQPIYVYRQRPSALYCVFSVWDEMHVSNPFGLFSSLRCFFFFFHLIFGVNNDERNKVMMESNVTERQNTKDNATPGTASCSFYFASNRFSNCPFAIP